MTLVWIYFYRLFFKLVLRHVDAEKAHALASRSLRAVRATRPGRALVRALAGVPDERLQVRALGLTFPSPLGVAAGVDKDASWFEDLGALGFGFVEVGTVTAGAQKGNPPPRVARLTRDRGLLNNMGFPNPGARVVADRLRGRSAETIVGVNVGKSKRAPIEAIGDDYRATVREVTAPADYLVVNVSSPNTPGLRDMQAVELLRPLIADVRAELQAIGTQRPILIKIGPDLRDGEIDAVCDLAMELDLDGIVAVNTTVDRRGVRALTDDALPFEGGGISGAPLRARALSVLTRIRARVGESMVIISVGGIGTPDDAWARVLAGATLIQAHTGFIYGGPAWPRWINRGLVRRVRKARHASIQTLIGAAALTAERGSAGDGDRLSGMDAHHPAGANDLLGAMRPEQAHPRPEPSAPARSVAQRRPLLGGHREPVAQDARQIPSRADVQLAVDAPEMHLDGLG